jgi:hypothetical protein
MNERTFRRILFAALLLVAPTIIYLVQVVFVVPTVFVPAGLFYMFYKLVAHGWSNDVPIFIVFFVVHLAVFGSIYALLAWLVGKLCCLFVHGWLRLVPLALLLVGLGALTQLSIYGGGGHGPMKVGPIQDMLAELGRDYGSGAVYAVYGSAVFLCCLPVLLGWLREWRRKGKG